MVLFIGDGMGDSEITVARDYLKGANGHFDGLDAVGQPSALGDVQAGTGQYTTFSVGNGSKGQRCRQAMATASWSPTPIRASLPP